MQPANPPLNVVVKHDRPLLAMGVHAALSQRVNLCVRAESAGEPDVDGEADVVVADYATGLRLMASAGTGQPRQPPANVLILTTRQRSNDIEQALRTGVRAYVLAGCEVAELVCAVEMVARGSRYLCAETAQSIAESFSCEPLTKRQTEVLELLSRGMANKSIGRALGLSEGTVKAHVKALLMKLGAQSRTEAMSIAIRRGVVAAHA